jgi:flagellar motor protein MotB
MRIGLRDSSLILESPFTSPDPLQLDPISITLTDLHWPFQGESTVDAAININSTATAVVAGTLTLDTGDATLQYSLSDFQLPLIDAALPEELQAVLAGGTVSAEGTASLHEFAPVNLTSNIEVKDFALQDANSEITLSEWRTLQFKDIDANFDEAALSIAQVNLVRYNGIIHLDESGTLNLANLWKETGADVDSPEAEPAEESAAANTDSRPGSSSDENNTSDTNWSVDLPELTISESSVDFTDRSLPIVFRTTIKEIEGKVRGLNNEVSQEATVDIRGTVDGYSPVLLTGTFNLLVDPAAHDLALKFKALDLSSLSPYASTYAGREIDRGLLNANLSYKMQQPNFTGEVSLRIEKLKLGARVESDKALDLPLDLALAILTDTRGVIEMNVPVGGDISEPGYQFGSVITKAMVGIIREAVTSPFKLLASIVGSEQDFSHINFAPGSSTLDEKGIQALGKLAAALQQRPAIKLKIFGKIDPESDRRGLQKLILKEQLIKAGLTEEEIAEKGAVLERAIDKRFQALADDKAEQRDLPILEKLDQVLEEIPIPDQTLLELSTRRATAVHDVLVTQLGLQDDRISVKEAVLEKSENNFSGALLSVK